MYGFRMYIHMYGIPYVHTYIWTYVHYKHMYIWKYPGMRCVGQLIMRPYPGLGPIADDPPYLSGWGAG